MGPDGRLNLGVATTDEYNASNPAWNSEIIYSQGAYCAHQVRITTADGTGVNLGVSYGSNHSGHSFVENTASHPAAFPPAGNYTADEAAKTWSVTYHYEDPAKGINVDVIASVHLEDKGANNQYYDLSYDVVNHGGDQIEIDFMYHMDTKYAQDNTDEGYFVNGEKLTKQTLYSKDGSTGNTSPDALSIWNQDPDDWLGFTVSVVPPAGNPPDYISVGDYSVQTGYWKYYDNPDLFNENASMPSGGGASTGGIRNGVDG